jgi:hypothetical protein
MLLNIHKQSPYCDNKKCLWTTLNASQVTELLQMRISDTAWTLVPNSPFQSQLNVYYVAWTSYFYLFETQFSYLQTGILNVLTSMGVTRGHLDSALLASLNCYTTITAILCVCFPLLTRDCLKAQHLPRIGTEQVLSKGGLKGIQSLYLLISKKRTMEHHHRGLILISGWPKALLKDPCLK